MVNEPAPPEVGEPRQDAGLLEQLGCSPDHRELAGAAQLTSILAVEVEFTVEWWDQRDTAVPYGPGISPETTTVEQFGTTSATGPLAAGRPRLRIIGCLRRGGRACIGAPVRLSGRRFVWGRGRLGQVRNDLRLRLPRR